MVYSRITFLKGGMKMKRKLRALNSQSDSLYITIPKYLVEILELKQDMTIDIELKGKKIIINTDVKTKEI